MVLPPFSLARWISEHEHLLRPPVGNKCLVSTDGYFVMVVGGPNERADFHFQPTEELFYQYKGAMTLSIIEDGQFRNITIGEGEMFLLPANTPHSPRRYADTIGLVLERTRSQPGAFALLLLLLTRCLPLVLPQPRGARRAAPRARGALPECADLDRAPARARRVEGQCGAAPLRRVRLHGWSCRASLLAKLYMYLSMRAAARRGSRRRHAQRACQSCALSSVSRARTRIESAPFSAICTS